MDKMAVALNMDPIEFRRINDATKDAIEGKPFSSHSLMECYDQAPVEFGWAERNSRVGSMQDGDCRTARVINRDLQDYLVPVNADIQEVKVILVPEVDDDVNPAGVKGLGELGNVGTPAAVASAVYHATGKRIRELPIRIDSLIG